MRYKGVVAQLQVERKVQSAIKNVLILPRLNHCYHGVEATKGVLQLLRNGLTLLADNNLKGK